MLKLYKKLESPLSQSTRQKDLTSCTFICVSLAFGKRVSRLGSINYFQIFIIQNLCLQKYQELMKLVDQSKLPYLAFRNHFLNCASQNLQKYFNFNRNEVKYCSIISGGSYLIIIIICGNIRVIWPCGILCEKFQRIVNLFLFICLEI